MIRTTLLGAALVLPVLALSGTAEAGNTSWIPTAGAPKPVPQAYEAFAQAPATHPGGYECRYQGGPKAPMLHTR